jgi:diguanylate cyclase (GGDEF)-like protein
MTHDPVPHGGHDTFPGAVRLYEQAARLAKLGAWECCLETEKLTWTEGVYDLFEICPGSPIRRPAVLDLYAGESRQAMEAMRAEVLATGMSCTDDFEIRTVRGASRWMRLSIDVAHEDGRPVRLFGAKQDITREHEAWFQLRQSAERDPLTGLANRAAFDRRYRAMVEDRLNHGHVSALVLVDLDHFKRFNDGFGHLAGDEYLRQVARRLRRVFADAALIARIGGDEFAVLLRAPLSQAQVRHILHRASVTLCKPVRWNGVHLDAGASIGATILGRPHTRKASELFAEADAALYDAKTAGRMAVKVFGGDPHRAMALPAEIP